MTAPHTRPHDTDSPSTRPTDASPFVCPACNTPLTHRLRGAPDARVPALEPCPACGRAWSDENGLLSFDPRQQATTDDSLASLARLVEREGIRAASRSAVMTPDWRGDCFDVSRDAWLLCATDLLEGRCLEVGAGTGRRSSLLAAVADSVYAVDGAYHAVRVASAREDLASNTAALAPIVPVHARPSQLPFAPGSFDTIVVDLRRVGAATTDAGDGVRHSLEYFHSFLGDGGSMIVLADGITGVKGSLDVFERSASGHSPISLPPIQPRYTPAWYREVAQSLGFEAVSVLATVPSGSNPSYLFDVEHEESVRQLLAFALEEAGRWSPLGERVLSVLEANTRSRQLVTSLLARLYPSYVILCHDQQSASSDDAGDTQPLVCSGRARSVVLEQSVNGLERVWKVPNSPSNAPLTTREHAHLTWLRAHDDPIVDTLPAGDSLETPFGVARTERPVRGEPLSTYLDGRLDSFEQVLETGLEWLVDFQTAFGSERVVCSPEAVREQLRFEPTNIESPPLEEPVETFVTPVHGDFMPSNVHTTATDVTTETSPVVACVIDWEYSALEGCPIVDAGLFVLDTAKRVFGDYPTAVEAIFGDGPDDATLEPYVTAVSEAIGAYCEGVSLPERTFRVLLPMVYLHRLEIDWNLGTTASYTAKLEARSRFVERLFDVRT